MQTNPGYAPTLLCNPETVPSTSQFFVYKMEGSYAEVRLDVIQGPLEC